MCQTNKIKEAPNINVKLQSNIWALFGCVRTVFEPSFKLQCPSSHKDNNVGVWALTCGCCI